MICKRVGMSYLPERFGGLPRWETSSDRSQQRCVQRRRSACVPHVARCKLDSLGQGATTRPGARLHHAIGTSPDHCRFISGNGTVKDTHIVLRLLQSVIPISAYFQVTGNFAALQEHCKETSTPWAGEKRQDLTNNTRFLRPTLNGDVENKFIKAFLLCTSFTKSSSSIICAWEGLEVKTR